MRPLKWEIRKNLNHKSQNDTQEIDKFNGAFEIEFSLTFTWPGLSLLRGPTQLNSILSFYVVGKGPSVFVFDEPGSVMNISKNIKVENQIKMALKTYVESRYNWDASSIDVKLKDAKNFIELKNEKLFDKSMLDLLKFAKEKSVSQKTYVEAVNLDLKSHVAFITGDLITSIQGLKAVSNLRLTLEFTEGPRTYLNPWGIYISKEKEQ